MAEHSEPHGLSQKLGPPSWSFRFLRCFRQQSVNVHSLPEFGPEGGPTFFESPFCAAAIGAWAIVPGSPFPLVYCARLFRIHLTTFRLCEKLPSTMYVQCRLGHAPKQRAIAAWNSFWGAGPASRFGECRDISVVEYLGVVPSELRFCIF